MGTRTYHGFEHTNNIISSDLTGGDRRTLYVNEGGTAQSGLKDSVAAVRISS